MPNKNVTTQTTQTHGQCVRCAANCGFQQCVGPKSDQCTGCNLPKILVRNKHPDAYLATTVESGTCLRCSTACKDGHCVGERSDQCTACFSDRMLINVPAENGNGTANYGRCDQCASNCRIGKCAGVHSYECTACNDNQVLITATDGPYAGASYGSCLTCPYTCAAKQCIGEKTWQCTSCPVGRTLVPAAEGKTYGYCAANTVVETSALEREIEEQAAEIKMLKKEDLAEARGRQAENMDAMMQASKSISTDMNDVATLAQSTVFAAKTSRVLKDLGSAQDQTGLGVMELGSH